MPTAWFADLTYTQQTIAADVFPAAVGSIGAYVKKQLNLFDIKIFKYPEKLSEKLENSKFPDYIFFSNYMWNSSLALNFSRKIKIYSPETTIIFGGPNYPIDNLSREKFLQDNLSIDYYIRLEGERTAVELLNKLETGFDREKQLTGVDYISDQGNFIVGLEQSKIKDLSELTSPYLEGYMDEFFDGKLLPIIQTNRGCPFTCSFCSEGTEFYNRVSHYPLERINAEIIYIAKKMKEIRKSGGRNDLYIADSNFGMYPRDLKICETIQYTRDNLNYPDNINVSTGKNSKERVLEAATILKGALRLGGSVQSFTPEVLENIKRKNIDALALAEMGLKASEIGANTYSEIIMCLPGESLSSHLDTIKQVIESGFNYLETFQLMILPGTPMGEPDYLDRYGMKTRYRVLPRCYGHFSLFNDQLVTAEIEQICVETNTFSFEDYLKGRIFHLIIHSFYNDSIFKSVLVLLRSLNVSPYLWLLKIFNQVIESVKENNSSQPNLFKDFLEETQSELWEKEDDLVKITSDINNIKCYIDGEIGRNLIYAYKVKLVFDNIRSTAKIAKKALYELLKESNIRVNPLLIKNIFDFHISVVEDLFNLEQTSRELKLDYPIHKFIDSEQIDQTYLLPNEESKESINLIVNLSNSQKDLISRMLSVYGSTNVATSRILSKVHLSRLLRKPFKSSSEKIKATSKISKVIN